MFDSIFFSIFVVLCLCLFNFVCASSCCATRHSRRLTQRFRRWMKGKEEKTDAQMEKREQVYSQSKAKRARASSERVKKRYRWRHIRRCNEANRQFVI